MKVRLTPAQVRGARGVLDWSRLDLSIAARVSISTVKRVEDGQAQPVSDSICEAIRNAFESEGVRFLADDEDGPGIRFKVRRTAPDLGIEDRPDEPSWREPRFPTREPAPRAFRDARRC